MSIINDLTAIADSIYSVRDKIGAVIQPISLVWRTWTGSAAGEGTAVENKVPLLPSPATVLLADTLKGVMLGTDERSDVILKGISKQSWPNRDIIACISPAENIEKFYEIGIELYRVIQVTESYISWNVTVRRLNDQTRHL